MPEIIQEIPPVLLIGTGLWLMGAAFTRVVIMQGYSWGSIEERTRIFVSALWPVFVPIIGALFIIDIGILCVRGLHKGWSAVTRRAPRRQPPQQDEHRLSRGDLMRLAASGAIGFGGQVRPLVITNRNVPPQSQKKEECTDKVEPPKVPYGSPLKPHYSYAALEALFLAADIRAYVPDRQRAIELALMNLWAEKARMEKDTNKPS